MRCAFYFFRLDRAPFLHAHIPFPKPDPPRRQSPKPVDIQFDSYPDFWCTTRIITEAIFYILLLSYKNSLCAYYERPVAAANDDGNPPTITLESLR